MNFYGTNLILHLQLSFYFFFCLYSVSAAVITHFLLLLSERVPQLGQNIWNKVKKLSKIEQQQRSLTPTFAQFLTAIAGILFLEERLGARLYIQPILRFT